MKFLQRSFMILIVLAIVGGCAQTGAPAVPPSPPAQEAEPGAPAAASRWPGVPEPDYWPTRSWQTTTPEAQGLDSGRLHAMFAAVQARNLDLHSVLVICNGYLVLEAYFDPYEAGDAHTIELNTKSVVATLVGMAIDQGKIVSVDQKLLDFFPEATVQQLDERKASISLHNLLAMTPGLDCEDFSASAQGMYASLEWVRYLLDLPMTGEPGQKWVYCSGAAHLLSAVLQQTTGMDARTYANRYLFHPLGIPGATQANWGTDPLGITNGIAGLYLPPSDLAKLGFLYLHKGNWNGQQIVSQAWIEAATREQAYIGPDEYVGGLDRRFGYMFSIFPDQKLFGYLGRAGQELFVAPEQNMVVVFTAGLEVGKEASLLELVNDFILPAAQSQAALPDNPDARAQLEADIRAAAGQTQPVPPLPQTALEISGVTFVLDENPFGWLDMTYDFQPGAEVAKLSMSEVPELTIGLDNRYRLNVDPDSEARPIGLRGRWLANGDFRVEDITLGDFNKSEVLVEFKGDGLRLTVTI